MDAPPSWAATATWVDNALSLELPVERASEIGAELIESKEARGVAPKTRRQLPPFSDTSAALPLQIEVEVAGQCWTFPLPTEVTYHSLSRCL